MNIDSGLLGCYAVLIFFLYVSTKDEGSILRTSSVKLINGATTQNLYNNYKVLTSLNKDTIQTEVSNVVVECLTSKVPGSNIDQAIGYPD
jgi:hypothetical protein